MQRFAKVNFLSGAHSYLQKPCSLDHLLEALNSAYKKKVMNKKKIEQKTMNELLKVYIYGSARDVMRRLKEIDKEVIS